MHLKSVSKGNGCQAALASVFFDHATSNADDTVGALGDILIVGHHDDAFALGYRLLKQGHNFVARSAVEVPGRPAQG